MLTPPTNPFPLAERYIQLRKQCEPPAWIDIVFLANEMITGPLITLFLLLIGSVDVFMVISTSMNAFKAWQAWEEFHALRSVVYDMALLTAKAGGPFIRTNDPTYYPYVLADAMVRLS
jgi:hypothetical protein